MVKYHYASNIVGHFIRSRRVLRLLFLIWELTEFLKKGIDLTLQRNSNIICSRGECEKSMQFREIQAISPISQFSVMKTLFENGVIFLFEKRRTSNQIKTPFTEQKWSHTCCNHIIRRKNFFEKITQILAFSRSC